MSDIAISELNSLLRRSTVEDHAEVLKLANAAIKATKPGNPNLPAAQHAKVVALLRLDRFEDALATISAAGTVLKSKCVLEKAYALYKVGRLAEAEHLLDQAPEDKSLHGRAIEHVRAQVAYRQEKFDQAAQIYQGLRRGQGGLVGEEIDLNINSLAVAAQLGWDGKGLVSPRDYGMDAFEKVEGMDAFEIAFNAACRRESHGNLSRASVLLKRAENLCQAAEDLSDDEKKAELIPILLQQAYVCARMSRDADAILYKNKVLEYKSHITDTSTRIAAEMNSIAIDSYKNPYFSHRLMGSIPAATANDKLFDRQASVMKRNKYAIALQAHKFTGVRRTTEKILKCFGDSTPAISAERALFGVLYTAALSELRTGKDALCQIRRTSPPYCQDEVGYNLTAIQMHMQMQNPTAAASLLHNFRAKLKLSASGQSEYFAPGLVALAVSLYRRLGRKKAIRAELAAAAAYWARQDLAPRSSHSLLREAGLELVHSSETAHLKAAGAAFEMLDASCPDDATVAAGLVASFAMSHYDKVEPHLSSLAPVQDLIADVDVTSLITGGIAPLPARTSPTQPSKRKRMEHDSDQGRERPAIKKRRKHKLPKNYEEGKVPDPERWLPLRDRSTYRPKGKKGKKRAAETTQGGVAKPDATALELGSTGGQAPSGGGGRRKGKRGKK